MKKIFILLSVFALLFGACSNDLNLVAPAKDIPIVYGFLSRSDTAQYIRIEKAFVDPSKSAIELAQDPAQLYFSDVTAEIQEVDTKKSFLLKRVDGNLEGYKRTNGAFATSPNYLYKIKTSAIDLKENKAYKLVVKRKDGSVLTEVTTLITPDMQLNEDRTPPADFSVVSGFTISWLQTNYQTAKLYDIILHFNVEERDVSGTTWVPKKLSWNVAKGYSPTSIDFVPAINNVNYRYKDGFGFFQFLANNLDKTKPVVRKLRDIDVEILSGGQNLYEYTALGNINSGITGTEVLPNYVQVKDGYGMLSSRNYLYYKGLSLGNRSLDSLRNSRLTKALKFQ